MVPLRPRDCGDYIRVLGFQDSKFAPQARHVPDYWSYVRHHLHQLGLQPKRARDADAYCGHDRSVVAEQGLGSKSTLSTVRSVAITHVCE